MDNTNQVISAIFSAIDEVNAVAESEKIVKKAKDTVLFGEGGHLDSLGLVGFLVAVEQQVEETCGKAITLADEKAMSQKRSPFRTVGTLAEYINSLLDE